jgi:hypothetical protein
MEQTGSRLLPVFGRTLRRITPGAAVAASALGVTLFFLAPFHSVLVVKTARQGKTVLCARMTEGEEWTVSFLHSVNKRPVYDYLRIEGKEIRILRSRYDAFGAGMPETTSPENPLRIGPDGWLEYTVNRLVPEVSIFVGRVARHELHLKGRKIPFTSLAQPGIALRFTAEKKSFVQILIERCLWK